MAAYVIVEVSISDEDAYEKYKPLAAASIAAHGGSYKARGGATETLEGEPVAGRIVVLEFPDLERARGWYHSQQYGDAMQVRQGAAQSRMFIVDGYEQV